MRQVITWTNDDLLTSQPLRNKLQWTLNKKYEYIVPGKYKDANFHVNLREMPVPFDIQYRLYYWILTVDGMHQSILKLCIHNDIS